MGVCQLEPAHIYSAGTCDVLLCIMMNSSVIKNDAIVSMIRYSIQLWLDLSVEYFYMISYTKRLGKVDFNLGPNAVHGYGSLSCSMQKILTIMIDAADIIR